ncbi:MAG: FMN-binding protein [Clostridium sp.]|uniref:FMN-binding protein n=1 Tax=Clostridium sp. TaxID=1506 RepID=UPI003F3C8FA2
MKKKLLLALCTVAMTMSLVACGGDKPEEKPQEPAAKTMQDGTYEVESKPDAEGKGAKATIVVKDGKIAEAKYNEFTKDGNKREDKKYNEMMMKQAKTSPEVFEVKFEEQVVAAQSSEIDGVTGATGSVATAKELFKNAIDNSLEGNKEKEVIEIKK